MSLYRPVVSPTISSKYSERNERVVALVVEHFRSRSVEAALDAALKARMLMSSCFVRRRACLSAMHIAAAHRTAVSLHAAVRC